MSHGDKFRERWIPVPLPPPVHPRPTFSAGFGRTALPPHNKFTYNFENLARVIGRLAQPLNHAVPCRSAEKAHSFLIRSAAPNRSLKGQIFRLIWEYWFETESGLIVIVR
jgi:hypothetical protein